MSDPFARVPLWILGRSDVSWPAKVLYGLLARYVGKGREAWPSVDVLAADMRTSRRNVERWLKELRAAGVLDIERTGRANTYRLLGAPPDEPPDDGPIEVPDASRLADQMRQPQRIGSADGDGSDPPAVADQIRQGQRIVAADTSFCEEKIEEKIKETPPAPKALNEYDLFDAYVASWDARCPDLERDGHSYSAQRSPAAAEWRELASKVRRQAVLSKTTDRAVLAAVLAAFFEDEFAAGCSFPPKLLVSRFSKYAVALSSAGLPTSPAKRREGYVALRATPGEFGEGDFGDGDIPADDIGGGRGTVIGYG